MAGRFLRIPVEASDVRQAVDRAAPVPARLSEETVVATGRRISLTHRSAGQFHARPTVSFGPVTDLAPSSLAPARRADETPQPLAFVDAALDATASRLPT